MAPYHGRGEMLLKDLKRFDPDVLMLGWCESRDGDVTLLLRLDGFFSYMMFRYDLQIITKNPEAKPDCLQMGVIEKLGNLSLDYDKNYPLTFCFFQLVGSR